MIHGCCFELGWSIFPLRTQKTLNGSGMVVSMQVAAMSSRLEYSENPKLMGFKPSDHNTCRNGYHLR